MALCAAPAIASSTAGGGRLKICSITGPSSHPSHPGSAPGSACWTAYRQGYADANRSQPIERDGMLGRHSQLL